MGGKTLTQPGSTSRGHVTPCRKSWLDSLGSLGPLAAFGVGFAMGFRPKALVLGAAAGLTLASNSLTQTEDAIAVGIYIVVSASTVAVPSSGPWYLPIAWSPVW